MQADVKDSGWAEEEEADFKGRSLEVGHDERRVERC